MTDAMTDEEARMFDAGMEAAYGADREVRHRIWAFERVQMNPMLAGASTDRQIAEANRIVAWLNGEGDGGQKTPIGIAA